MLTAVCGDRRRGTGIGSPGASARRAAGESLWSSLSRIQEAYNLVASDLDATDAERNAADDTRLTSVANAVADYLNAIARAIAVQTNADAASRADFSDSVSSAAVIAYQAHVDANAAHSQAIAGAEADHLLAVWYAQTTHVSAADDAGRATTQAAAEGRFILITGLIDTERTELLANAEVDTDAQRMLIDASVALTADFVNIALAYRNALEAAGFATRAAYLQGVAQAADDIAAGLDPATATWLRAVTAVRVNASLDEATAFIEWKSARADTAASWILTTTHASAAYAAIKAAATMDYYVSVVDALAAYAHTSESIQLDAVIEQDALHSQLAAALIDNRTSWTESRVAAAFEARTQWVAGEVALKQSESSALQTLTAALVSHRVAAIAARSDAFIDVVDAAGDALVGLAEAAAGAVADGHSGACEGNDPTLCACGDDQSGNGASAGLESEQGREVIQQVQSLHHTIQLWPPRNADLNGDGHPDDLPWEGIEVVVPSVEDYLTGRATVPPSAYNGRVFYDDYRPLPDSDPGYLYYFWDNPHPITRGAQIVGGGALVTAGGLAAASTYGISQIGAVSLSALPAQAMIMPTLSWGPPSRLPSPVQDMSTDPTCSHDFCCKRLFSVRQDASIRERHLGPSGGTWREDGARRTELTNLLLTLL